MNAITAEVVTDEEKFDALEPEWRDLWNRLPAALPFQAPAWLIPWWRHFHPGKLFVLAARCEGRLVGLAPGYIEDGPLGRRILPLGISLSDHLDILVDRGCAEPAVQALVDAALFHCDAWDIWELEELPPGAAALSLPLPPGYAETLQPQSACPVLALADDTDAVLPSLPKPKRQNLNLARNRSARRGGFQIARAQGEAIAPAFAALVRLHGNRWEGRGEPGVLTSGPGLDFHREAMLGLDQAGLLRLFTLSIEGQIAAAHYGIACSGRHYVYLLGFDPDFAFESPGVLLMAHAIEEALAEGCLEVDFLRGQEQYKYDWGAIDRWNVKRSIFRAEHG
ncbi:MAG TPA: GNAT family N-acetyltransferase [Propylenella sp.]|nr:GNAT family N-acetyltransferase [Propylenella sp.]